MIRFTVPGMARPCPRPRVTRRGTYYPPAYEVWRKQVRWAVLPTVRAQGYSLWESRVGLECKFYGAHGAADVDNLAKAIMDSLTGIVYLDDRPVDKLVAERFPAKEDKRVEGTVGEIDTGG